jgi:hypothetical protein
VHRVPGAGSYGGAVVTAGLAAPGPVIGAGLWRQVIDRAGERCECRTECGRKHTGGQGRCNRENGPYAPLHAVPRDPAPFHAAAVLDAAALFALCDPCHAAVALMRARARRAALDALSAAETLF